MKWKTFGDEKPNNEEKILLLRKFFVTKAHVQIIIARNPYIGDKKYNPNYWCYLDELRKEVVIEDDDHWCRIELPKKD